jgi:cytochrome P450
MPHTAVKGKGLHFFAQKMLQERLNNKDPKRDFMEHVTNAKDENGKPYHTGQSELIAEYINLIVGGKLGPHRCISGPKENTQAPIRLQPR